MDFKEQVYDSIIGALIEPIPDVENLFEKGKPYYVSYGRVYDACQRLYERLENFEDIDVEIIVDSMFDMQREVALKMYDYGAKFRDNDAKIRSNP